jgi:hypothetical protein
MNAFRSFVLGSIGAMALVCVMGADTLRPGPSWVDSGDQQHRWLIRDGRQWVGIHNDAIGTWIDLRSAAAKSFPEFAVYVPRHGGSPKLQVCDTNQEPVTIDLVKAARILQRLIEKEKE